MWHTDRAMEYVYVYVRARAHTTETLRMLEVAFREHISGKTQFYEWFSKFGNGVMSVEDCEHSGCPHQANEWICGLSGGTSPQKQKNHYLWSF